MEYNFHYGETTIIGNGFPLNNTPFTRGGSAYTIAGSVHFSTRPTGLPFRIKVGNQIIFRDLGTMRLSTFTDSEKTKLLHYRIPIDVVFSFGNSVSFSFETGLYGSALLYMTPPNNRPIDDKRRTFQVGAHFSFGIAKNVSEKGRIGLSLHYYRDLSPVFHDYNTSPGGGTINHPLYGFDNCLSLSYTIKLN